jgi:hypothetical protein
VGALANDTKVSRLATAGAWIISNTPVNHCALQPIDLACDCSKGYMQLCVAAWNDTKWQDMLSAQTFAISPK